MKGWLFLALWTICYLVKGQSIDLFTLSFKHGFGQPVSGQPANAAENVALLNLKVPIVFSESTIWYSDLTYQGFVVNYGEGATGVIDPTRLHGVILQTGLVRKLSETTGFQLLLAPRFMSDFQEIDQQHFQLGGIGLFEKKYSERLLMRYGLMYNRELFGHMFVPLVFVNWKLSERWSLNGLLPVFGKLNYQASPRLGMGLSLFGLITSFQLGDPAYDGDYIERKSVDLSVYGRYNMVGNLHLEARFGYALGRSYRQFEEGDEVDFRITIASFGDDRVQQNVDFSAGPIVDVRLVYNLPLD
ncbi:DUF6268 family outer membrane beta-barrel protein [Marinoscillum sp.]|uniref:DUF6268 family outer membrane beta-barrel protein n=1 Tax=Marinoscillum sp. TaxID=2024838 RepID=UPI003BAC33FE